MYIFTCFTDKELEGLIHFNVFIIKIYIQHWFTCTIATHAAVNDILLIDQLKKYQHVNTKVADIALKTIARHLWYLSDIALGFSFFDPRHSVSDLINMSAALEIPGDNRNLYRNVLMNIEKEVDITKLISENTLMFFEILGVDWHFLKTHPSSWSENTNYQKTYRILKNLTVVNDPAERAIGLIKSINNTLTANEARQNDVIQVIEQYNKAHQNGTKSTIIQNLNKD